MRNPHPIIPDADARGAPEQTEGSIMSKIAEWWNAPASSDFIQGMMIGLLLGSAVVVAIGILR